MTLQSDIHLHVLAGHLAQHREQFAAQTLNRHGVGIGRQRELRPDERSGPGGGQDQFGKEPKALLEMRHAHPPQGMRAGGEIMGMAHGLDFQRERTLPLESGARFGGNDLVGFLGSKRCMAGIGIGCARREQGTVEHPFGLGEAFGYRTDLAGDLGNVSVFVIAVQDRQEACLHDPGEHRIVAQPALVGEACQHSMLRRIEPHGLGAGAHDGARTRDAIRHPGKWQNSAVVQKHR